MPEDETFLTDDEKAKIIENNKIIDRNERKRTERIQEIGEGIKETINKIKPPSLIEVASRTFKKIVGKPFSQVIAGDGIGTMIKRSKRRKSAKQSVKTIFRRK